MTKIFQPEQIELSNGIPVILQHVDSPVAASYWWVKTGSADESPKEAGFAHFLEHMLFKDASAKETGRASVGKMARTIESLGGDINAYTSFDQTVYHVTCAAQHWEKVMDAFGGIAKPQRFLSEDFKREREVILEELRKNEDSPGRQLFQNLFTLTFSKHPYGRPVIGFVETLKAAKTAQLEAFYRRNYVSGKMGIVLVGPIQDSQGARKKELVRYLEKHFGSRVLKRKSAPIRERVGEPEIKSQSQWKVQPFDVKTPTLSVSFRVPGLEHEDIPALDLLGGILGAGEMSRLYQKLFYQTSLVTDVSGGMYVPKDPGMLYFQAEFDSMEKIKPATRAIFEELMRITEEGPTAEELSRVLVNAESERLYATQTADGMAGRLGFLKFIMGDLEFDREYLDQLRLVDGLKIKEVAKKYFDSRRLSGVVLVPESQAHYETIELQQLGVELLHGPSQGVETRLPSILSKEFKSAKGVKSGELPVEFAQLSSGIRICYLPRPSSQVFSVYASVLGGVRLELAHPVESADKDWGSSSMMALTWAKGTSVRDARAIASITEGKASSLDGFSGRNSVGLQLTGLARDWSGLSDLFSEVLVDPVFPRDEVDHSRRIAEDAVRSIEDHSSQLCSKLFLETLFEKHPYGRMSQGSLESLKTIGSEKLRSFHRNWLRPDRLVISVSGAVKRSAFEAWLHDLESRMKALTKLSSQFLLPEKLEDEAALKAPRWVERSLEREQAHIFVGGLGTRITAEDRHAMRILQTLLGGQSGRLFIELREKKSLAYTVSPVSFEGIERGYCGTYIACAPQKKQEAIDGMRKVLEDLLRKPPTAQEMSRAKEYYLGRRAMDLQSDGALATHFGLESLYRVPYQSELQLTKKIKAMSAREVQQVCKKYLVEPFQVTCTVG
jgi:zinc protease